MNSAPEGVCKEVGSNLQKSCIADLWRVNNAGGVSGGAAGGGGGGGEVPELVRVHMGVSREEGMVMEVLDKERVNSSWKDRKKGNNERLWSLAFPIKIGV